MNNESFYTPPAERQKPPNRLMALLKQLLSGEQSHDNARFLDFFNLNNKEKKLLATRVGRWQGLVRIFVHPFFTEYKGPYGYDYYPKTDCRVSIGLKRLLRLPEKKTPPIMILEEAASLHTTRDKLSGYSINQKAYFVATIRDNPTPTGFEDGFAHLAEELKSVGVNRVLIGGIYLHVVDNYLVPNDLRTSPNHPLFNQRSILSGNLTVKRKDFSFNGCAGYAALQLAQHGLDISFSNFASPQNMSDISSALKGKDIVEQRAMRTARA